MPNIRGIGDGLRVTVRLAVLVGAPRSALAGKAVKVSPAVTTRAATEAPARGMVMMAIAVSSNGVPTQCWRAGHLARWHETKAFTRGRRSGTGADLGVAGAVEAPLALAS